MLFLFFLGEIENNNVRSACMAPLSKKLELPLIISGLLTLLMM